VHSTKPSRLGPIETAIENTDFDALMAALAPRTVREEGTGCLRWTGNKRPSGYGMVGRDRTNRLTHRLVAWGYRGFIGEFRDFPSVHHSCGTRDCLEPQHTAPVVEYMNMLEMSVRTSLQRRISALESAIKSLNPDHPILQFPALAETPEAGFRTGRSFDSARERLRRRERQIARSDQRARKEQYRFGQVVEVQSLVAGGMTLVAALEKIGVNRRVHSEWERRWREWMAS
jgi:hypothetical protein